MAVPKGRYDFSGWATRNDLKCSDGRTIRRDAFKDCDGDTVPLVWQHQHNYLENVLGHALLENRRDGVYAYGVFNDTPEGRAAKARVMNGDITALSIYANQLTQQNGNVLHGKIRELSLVLSPANPGAYIEFPSLSHGDGLDSLDEVDECVIYTGMDIRLGDSLKHSYEEGESMDYEEIYDTLDDDQKELVDALVNQAAEDAADATADAYEDVIDEYEDTLDDYEDVLDEYEDAIGDEYDDDDEYYDDDDDEYYDDDDVEHGDYYGETFMKHNVFDDNYYDDDVLAHGDEEFMAFEEDVMRDIKRYGSFQDSFLAHAEEYGVTDLDYLFPEYHNLDDTPQFIKRKTEWVKKVIDGVRHTPFARIKSLFANITGEEARARGYIKGNRKKEEVFTLLKRVTTPTTVYKKQKIDRDDKLDLKNFKIVSWLQGEMKMMLEEESARVMLFPDGRPTDSEDHVNTNCIRPIWTDDDLFTIKKTVNSKQGEEFAETFINFVIKTRPEYRGSGKPFLFVTEDTLTDMLLLKDGMGRKLYKSVQELVDIMRLGGIVPLPNEIVPTDFLGLEVNLSDYVVGTDNGGEVTWFDQFDIDYNQMKYLAEARFSGALTVPYSAIAYKKVTN